MLLPYLSDTQPNTCTVVSLQILASNELTIAATAAMPAFGFLGALGLGLVVVGA
jgi:membrane-bound ClpP family serine protease